MASDFGMNMIQIGSAIVSLDIFERKFVCDLTKCKGACCLYGDSGAPLSDDEVAILQDAYPKIKPYMTAAGVAAVEQRGVYENDFDDEKVTPLVGDGEDCAYSFSKKGAYFCAIEKAFMNGDIIFRKPISCHLYPIRITKYKTFEAVNYHYWSICDDALKFGKKTETPLYVFLKEPLIRQYGAEWYEQLCLAALYMPPNR